MEVASIHTKALIEMLLHVHALTCMHRATRDEEHRRAAADWLPMIDSQLSALRYELTKDPRP